MPVVGATAVANNIRRYGGGFLKTVNATMKQVELILDRQVTKNLSRTDLSLKELADRDHPFAKRHGEEGIPVYQPYWMVHKRSGKLLSSKKSGTIPATIKGGQLTASAFVKLDPGVAKHALYVVLGTSRMIPRPVLEGSKQQIVDPALELIKNNLKFLTVGFR